MRLQGRIAIVTGASSGIGRAIAEVSAAEGATVVAASPAYHSSEPVVQGIIERGGTARFVACDISSETDVDHLFDEVVDQYGSVDVLVNNAGVNFAKPFEQTEVADWDRVVNTDLRGTFLCTRRAIRSMLRTGGGSIVNISSTHSVASLPGAAPYDAAKWGMIGLTKSLAVEFASRGIRVNAVSPGLIDTQIWKDVQDAAPDLEECLSYWRAQIPSGRVGAPEEIARVVVFLASDESSYMTGANVIVDGGMTSQLISAAPYESKPVEGR
jgi:NAD(P)-dependent dehydrogenase (short-subunit alcohol dehydrogenase family)